MGLSSGTTSLSPCLKYLELPSAAGWSESVAIWMCNLPAAIQAGAKEFELLLISHALVCRPSASARA